MSAHSLDPEERYASIVKALAGLSGVSQSAKKGFGFSGLTVAGKLFASRHKDGLLLKLPAAEVNALVAAGEGRRFEPGHGRAMKEWLVVGIGAGEDWLDLARAAMTFVASKT